jgi:hypothetical protein
MKKLLNILCLCLIFVPVSFAQNQTPEKEKSDSTTVDETKSDDLPDDEEVNEEDQDFYDCKLPPSVIALELSQTEIVLNCQASDKNCSNNKIIEVESIAVDMEDTKYVYIVSGGKIIGEGANIKWDLSDLKPGIYTITAGISRFYDSFGWQVWGKTETKEVVIK